MRAIAIKQSPIFFICHREDISQYTFLERMTSKMAAIILNERSAALSVTKVYQERLKKSAELVAKKELVSLSTAIDSAAIKGLTNVSFKLSTAVTKLTDNYHDIAIQIIEEDIRAAGYDAMRVLDKDNVVTGYEVSWAEAEEGGEGSGESEGSEEEDPAIQSPEDLIEAIASKDEVELTLSNDLTLAAPVAIAAGKKATIHLDNVITNDAQVAFQVNGGELVIDGEGEVIGAGRAIIAQNGGKVTINGGTYTSTSAGQTIGAIGADTEVIINDATVNSQEAAVMAFDGGTLTLNGGDYNTNDNFVVGTNGTSGRGGNTINIKNAVLKGNIQTNGYEACGVYIANNDTVNIEDSEIIAENGCGILMRAGNVIVKNTKITTTGTAGGWIGDKKKVMSNSGIIYDEASNYPGKEGMSLVCGPDVTFDCSGETVEILSNEETPNVTIVA